MHDDVPSHMAACPLGFGVHRELSGCMSAKSLQFSSVQSLSSVHLSVTP